MVRLLATLLLFCTAPAWAQNGGARPLPVTTNAQAAPAPEAALAARAAALERREANLALRKEMIETRAALADAGHARLQVIGGWLSAIIGLFGVVITIAVFVFAWRVERQAIAAAVQAAKDGLANAKEEIETMLRDATAMAERIRSHEQEVARIIDGLPPGEKPATEAERQIVEDAATIARKKPPAERTLDDLRALIVDSIDKADWPEMRDHARALLYLHGTNDQAAAMGLFNLANAHAELKRFDDAIATYDKLIARYVASDEPDVRNRVAMATYNKGLALGRLGRAVDEIAAYDDLNARFGASGAPTLRKVVADALFNKACVLARGANVAATIAALRDWAPHRGGFDCDTVRDDADFEPVRGDPSFIAFMAEMGCAPPG